VLGVALCTAVGLYIAAQHPTIAPAASTSPSGTLFIGTYTPQTPLDAADLKIAGGRYLVKYSVDARFVSDTPNTIVRCGLTDSTEVVSFLSTNSFQSVPGDDKTRRLTFSSTYVLPRITLGLHCFPSVTGRLTMQVTHVHLSAEPVSG
jgi:hypothetical protein